MNGKGLYVILKRFAPGALVLLLAGCSYVMDSIESAITARSSFSIEAEYSGGMVTIRWDEGSGLSSFAGYEIYVTLDEYDNYDLLASRFENESGTLVGAGDYKSLDNSFTGSYSDTPAPGIYFYRVGIIEWDEDDEQKRVDEWGLGYFYDPDVYFAHTSINKISGYRMVRVY